MNSAITRDDSLWAIADALQEAEASAAQSINEDGEVGAEWAFAADALNLTFEQKIEACGLVRQRLEAEEAGNDVIAAEATRHARAAERKKKRLDAYVMAQMQKLGRTKVITPTAKPRIQASPECAELAPGFDIDQVPEEYVRTEKKLKTRSLIDAMKAGAQFTWATLKQGSHLRWR